VSDAMARRHAFPFLGNGDKRLSSLLTDSQVPLPHEMTTPVAANAAVALRAGTYHVAPGFLNGELLEDARNAVASVFDQNALPPPMIRIVAAIEALRQALAAATGRPLLETLEIQLLNYREG